MTVVILTSVVTGSALDALAAFPQQACEQALIRAPGGLRRWQPGQRQPAGEPAQRTLGHPRPDRVGVQVPDQECGERSVRGEIGPQQHSLRAQDGVLEQRPERVRRDVHDASRPARGRQRPRQRQAPTPRDRAGAAGGRSGRVRRPWRRFRPAPARSREPRPWREPRACTVPDLRARSAAPRPPASRVRRPLSQQARQPTRASPAPGRAGCRQSGRRSSSRRPYPGAGGDGEAIRQPPKERRRPQPDRHLPARNRDAGTLIAPSPAGRREQPPPRDARPRVRVPPTPPPRRRG